MSDPETLRRLRLLEEGQASLKETDQNLVSEVSGLSSDTKLVSQALAQLTNEISRLIRHQDADLQRRIEEEREKGVTQARLSKIETGMKGVIFVAGAFTVAIIGLVVTSVLGGQ